MSPVIAAIITVVAGVLTHALVASYFYGRLTQRVIGHEKQLDDHERRLRRLEQK